MAKQTIVHFYAAEVFKSIIAMSCLFSKESYNIIILLYRSGRKTIRDNIVVISPRSRCAGHEIYRVCVCVCVTINDYALYS